MIAEIDILNGFASKIISDCIDVSINAIKNADKNRKLYNQNIQTRIYQVVIDALNKFADNKYKEQEVLYDAAECILKGFRNGERDSRVALGLKMINSYVNDDICKDFLALLRHEICKDENSDLYKEIAVIWQKTENEYIHEEFRKSNQNEKVVLGKLDDINADVNYIKEKIEGSEIYETERYCEVYRESRTEEYADKWDKNVFLNDFNERDEGDNKNVKLRKIYLEEHLPHYIWKANKDQSKDLRELLGEYIIENKSKKVLLILGQPGIGKSTLITWITANFLEKRDEIFVYQFASDLKNVNWQSDDLLNELLDIFGMNDTELENKVLILDGFDEIRIGGGRERILNQIYQELIELDHVKKFSLIITCRENFVYELQRVECDYITLQTWDSEQIQSFCRVYGYESTQSISKVTINKIIENKEILGTPLILYMVLALNITIDENGSIVDVYDKIFSLDGGSIYDRCIKNARFAKPHKRISKTTIKKQIHQISQKIAFWMFENNSEEAYISQYEYKKICDFVVEKTEENSEEVYISQQSDKEIFDAVINKKEEKGDNIQNDALIGNYFKLIKHCEGVGSEELQFVHRSIYEYFVSDYIFESIANLKDDKDLMGELGRLLKHGRLSEQILEFIKYKFKNYSINNLPNRIKDIFQVMLRDGMTYHMQERCNTVIECEINIFANMLEIVRLWNHSLGELDRHIISYLQYNSRSKLNLKGIKLGNVNLRRIYLDGANLNDVDLNDTNLEKAEMNGVSLREAQLNGAVLQGAYLKGTDLIGAYLRNANLSGADLELADLSGADLISAKLPNTNLEGAELIGARLINADLRGAKLNKAKLSRAELNGAVLCGAELDEIDMSGTYLRSAIFDVRQVELLNGRVDLSSSKVYIFETEEVISYEEYCIRMQ